MDLMKIYHASGHMLSMRLNILISIANTSTGLYSQISLIFNAKKLPSARREWMVIFYTRFLCKIEVNVKKTWIKL